VPKFEPPRPLVWSELGTLDPPVPRRSCLRSIRPIAMRSLAPRPGRLTHARAQLVAGGTRSNATRL
jgi:hypothetical protein